MVCMDINTARVCAQRNGMRSSHIDIVSETDCISNLCPYEDSKYQNKIKAKKKKYMEKWFDDGIFVVAYL